MIKKYCGAVSGCLGLISRERDEKNVINCHKIVCVISDIPGLQQSSRHSQVSQPWRNISRSCLSQEIWSPPGLTCLLDVIVIKKPSPRQSVVWVYLDVNSVLIFDQLNITIWHSLSTKRYSYNPVSVLSNILIINKCPTKF